MPVGTAVVDWQGKVPMLLKADGSAYAGMTYVRGWVPGHERKFPEWVQFANNLMGFALMGNSQGYMRRFQIECWSVGAMQGVMNDFANPENEGKYILEVPDLDSGAITRHTIRLLEEPDFSRTFNRRTGYVEVFTADVENIEVLT
jgi:hypothetical protein